MPTARNLAHEKWRTLIIIHLTRNKPYFPAVVDQAVWRTLTGLSYQVEFLSLERDIHLAGEIVPEN